MAVQMRNCSAALELRSCECECWRQRVRVCVCVSGFSGFASLASPSCRPHRGPGLRVHPRPAPPPLSAGSSPWPHLVASFVLVTVLSSWPRDRDYHHVPFPVTGLNTASHCMSISIFKENLLFNVKLPMTSTFRAAQSMMSRI